MQRPRTGRAARDWPLTASMAANIAMAVMEDTEEDTYHQIQSDEGTTAIEGSAATEQNSYVEVGEQNGTNTIENVSEGDYARLQPRGRATGQSSEEHPSDRFSTDREKAEKRKAENPQMHVATSPPCPALGSKHGSVVLCLLLASTLFSLGALILGGLSYRASTSHSRPAPEAALPGVAVGNGTQWNDTCSTGKLYFEETLLTCMKKEFY